MPTNRTPEDWRDLLYERLLDQRARVHRMRRYYSGPHPIPQPPRALRQDVFAEALRRYQHYASQAETNFTRLVADAPAKRLSVIGFRFSGDGGQSSADDDIAWRIWQRNHLDADSALLHTGALAAGNAYTMVWADEGEKAVITVEDPTETIVAYRPGSRRDRLAGFRSFVDDEFELAIVYLPDGIYKWRRYTDPDHPSRRDVRTRKEIPGWMEFQPDTDDVWPVPNPLGAVPIVEYRANPSLEPCRYGGGCSEFDQVIPIQDRINQTVFDRLVAAQFYGWPQRYAIGWEPPQAPDGNPDAVQTYRAAMSELSVFNNPDGDSEKITVGSFAQGDFSPFLKAVEADVRYMSAITNTPAYYLLGEMVNISSDALIAAETGLTSKTRDHAANFGEAHEETIRLALAVEGDDRAGDMGSMVLWGDIEQRSWGQTVDAAIKMQQLGVPTEALWARLPDVTPQDIARWRRMADAETFLSDDLDPVDADDET